MKLFNTLSRKVEEFKPLTDNTARIYSCGPTVYNFAHIGNLSSYIFADMLRRAVKLADYNTRQVMNLTDVDDKTIRDSLAEFPDLEPMDALAKLTRHYENIFMREMRAIGNDIEAVQFVRATDNIADMQNLIQKLLEQKVAYIADDGIYFSISEYQKTRTYGQLSKIEIAKNQLARIDNDEYDKDSAQDFALWKLEKPGEPAWDFEIDGKNLRGRPGWHLECSAMSVKNLGQPFDIHTGGIDLIFPHHENEIAQSTAGDQPESYANFFVHNGHLLVDDKKMAKSAHNFYTLPDIEKKGFGPLDFRLLVLQSHYRSATNFSWENLVAAHNRLRNWLGIAELRWQTEDSSDDGQAEIVNNLLDQATHALLDDLDTPDALKFIDAAVDVFASDSGNINHFALQNLIRFVDDNLGFDIENSTPDITDDQKKLIEDRAAARADKNFAKSDKIRDKLAEQGIELNDTPSSAIWSRK